MGKSNWAYSEGAALCRSLKNAPAQAGWARRTRKGRPLSNRFLREFCVREGPAPVPGLIARNVLLPPRGPGLALATPPSLLLRPHRVVARAAEGTQVRHVQPPLPRHAQRFYVVHRRRWRDSLVLQASLAQVVVPGQHSPPEPLPRGALVERPRPLVPTVPVVVPVDNAPVLAPLLVGPGVGRTIRLRRSHEFRTSWRSTRSLGSSHCITPRIGDAHFQAGPNPVIAVKDVAILVVFHRHLHVVGIKKG